MFGTRLSRLGSVSRLGLVPKAIAILRSYGADAHVYLPGIGTVNGITAGNYLDSAGTTAASVDNPVGLSLDALQAMTLGANIAVNGGFDTDTSWTKAANWSIAGGVATSNGGTGFLQANTSPLIAGKSYEVTVTIKRYVSGAIYYPYSGSGGVATPTAVGTYTSIHVASSSNLYVYSLSFNGDIDDVIVKEIPGIHATQGTTANKPILRRGLLNLATWSMDVSNAAWGASVAGSASAISRTPSYTTSPDGYPATRIQISLNSGTATGDISYLYQTVIPSTTICTGGIYIRSNTTDCSMYMRIGNSEYTIAVTSAWTLIPGVCLAGNTSNQFGFGLRGGQSSPCSNSIDVSIASAGLFKGTYTAQQIIDAGGIPLTTSAAASSATGKYWWQFDQSNDFLQTSITTGDAGWLCAGVTFTDSNSTLFCSGAGSAVQKGLWAYRDAASDTFITLIGNGTAPSSATAISAPAGQPLVIASGWDASNIFHSVNSTENTASRTGSASPSPATLRIGAYTDGITYPLGGNMNIALVFNVLPTADERLTLKRWVGQLSGVSL